jgi:hypothetical protein
MKNTLPTVDELNDIQAQWMKLESTDSEAKKNEVFALMETLPKYYVSASIDLKKGFPICNGGIVWSEEREIKLALAYVSECSQRFSGCRLDVVWVGVLGKWISIS